jgi:hypothetical protein
LIPTQKKIILIESEDINAVLALLSSDQPITRTKSEEKGKKNNSNVPIQSNPPDTGYVATGNIIQESQNWTEITSQAPTTSRTRPPSLPTSLSASVQSLYTPTLLSYDPIQNAPPGHTPLATVSPRPPSSARLQSSESENRSKDAGDFKPKSSLRRGANQSMEEPPTSPVGPTILSLPIPEVEIDPAPVVGNDRFISIS